MLIAGIGALAAWYGVKLCLLNCTLMTPGLEINLALLYASAVVGGVLLVVYAMSMIVAPPPRDPDAMPLRIAPHAAAHRRGDLRRPDPVLDADRVLRWASRASPACWLGGYPTCRQLPSSMVSGSQSWVLLAIPAFVFAGGLMEKCGMSHALVEFARALVGWVKGGLGMSVIVVAYFFSDICGSKMAEVSALGSTLMPPLTKAGYKREDSASLIAAGTAMGMLVPPAIFMIVIAQVTNTSAVALFLAGFMPAATIMVCLMVLVYFRARKYDWPVDTQAERAPHPVDAAAAPRCRWSSRSSSWAASSSASSPPPRPAPWWRATPSWPRGFYYSNVS